MKSKTLWRVLVFLIIITIAVFYIIFSSISSGSFNEKNFKKIKKIEFGATCGNIRTGAEFLSATRRISQEKAIALNCVTACSRENLSYFKWDCPQGNFTCYCRAA